MRWAIVRFRCCQGIYPSCWPHRPVGRLCRKTWSTNISSRAAKTITQCCQLCLEMLQNNKNSRKKKTKKKKKFLCESWIHFLGQIAATFASAKTLVLFAVAYVHRPAVVTGRGVTAADQEETAFHGDGGSADHEETRVRGQLHAQPGRRTSRLETRGEPFSRSIPLCTNQT